MDKLVLAKYNIKRYGLFYTQNILFILEPGMQLHVRLAEERERALRLLCKSRSFRYEELTFDSIDHIQVEDNEVTESNEASPPELLELQGIIAALDLIQAQLNTSNRPERLRTALLQAKANMLQRLAEFGKPSG